MTRRVLLRFLRALKAHACRLAQHAMSRTHRNVCIYRIDCICGKLVVGFTMPVEISGRILAYAQNFQFQYLLPQNATLFTEFFEDASSSRRRRESVSWNERMTVYRLLEEEFERWELFLPLNGICCRVTLMGMSDLRDDGTQSLPTRRFFTRVSSK